MTDPMKVVLKIVSVKGICAAGHKVGEEFDLSKDFILGGSSPCGLPKKFNYLQLHTNRICVCVSR